MLVELLCSLVPCASCFLLVIGADLVCGLTSSYFLLLLLRPLVGGAFQCFGFSGNVLRERLCEFDMACLALLRPLIVFFCAHRALGGDVRVKNHDVIDIHMEEPVSGSLGLLSGASLQEGNGRAVDGFPVLKEYELILQRQRRQTADVSAMYSETMSSAMRFSTK